MGNCVAFRVHRAIFIPPTSQDIKAREHIKSLENFVKVRPNFRYLDIFLICVKNTSKYNPTYILELFLATVKHLMIIS